MTPAPSPTGAASVSSPSSRHRTASRKGDHPRRCWQNKEREITPHEGASVFKVHGGGGTRKGSVQPERRNGLHARGLPLHGRVHQTTGHALSRRRAGGSGSASGCPTPRGWPRAPRPRSSSSPAGSLSPVGSKRRTLLQAAPAS
jgi:hypothetical protein